METSTKEIFILICLAIFASVNGCGVLPSRQGSTINFQVTGFQLPSEMAYSVVDSAPSQTPTISTSEQKAVTFVQNIVMQSIEYVLHQQGRGAGLSDDVISLILNQFDVTVNYEPLKCDIIFDTPTGNGFVKPSMINCQIISGTVTKTCSNPTVIQPAAAAAAPPQHTCMNKLEDIKPMYLNISGSITPDVTNCQIISGTVTKTCSKPTAKPPPPPPPPGAQQYTCMMKLEDIKPMHLSISGSITTTNIIMANWSTQMWQSVLNRALRSIASGPLGSHFAGASIILK